MTKLRAMAFLAVALAFLVITTFCGTKAHAQTRTREETHGLAVGRVDAEHEAVTVFSMVNRLSGRASLEHMYKDAKGGFTLKVKTTYGNGVVGHGLQGGTSLSSKSTVLRTLSSVDDVRSGAIETKGTETWSPKHQAYLPDAAVDVTIQVRKVATGEVVHTFQDSLRLTGGDSFLLQAFITPEAETGLAVVNPSGSAITLTLRLFDNNGGSPVDGNGVRLPIATETVKVAAGAAGEMLPIFLKKTFSSLPDDYMGNKLTEGSLEIEATELVGIVGFRMDGSLLSWLTVFQGRE